LAKKKKKTEKTKKTEPEKEEEKDIEEEFEEDFEEDLDIEKELNLLDTDDIDAEVEQVEKIIDKDEEKKQLYLSCGIHIGTKLLSGDAKQFVYRQTESTLEQNYYLEMRDNLCTDKLITVCMLLI
jgi:hypothetical protein